MSENEKLQDLIQYQELDDICLLCTKFINATDVVNCDGCVINVLKEIHKGVSIKIYHY